LKVLLCVLSHLVEDEGYLEVQRWIRLTRVSRGWKTALMEGAQFWTCIEARSARQVSRMLELSQGAFLDVRIPGARSAKQDHSRLFAPHMDRVRTLTMFISAACENGAPALLFGTSVPSGLALEELHIEAMNEAFASEFDLPSVPRAFLSSTPRLRKLILHGEFPWSHPLLKNDLHRLDVYCCGVNAPKLKVLATVLRRLRNLETLRFNSLQAFPDPEAELSPVQLTKLRSVHISLEVLEFLFFWDLLAVPASATVRIDLSTPLTGPFKKELELLCKALVPHLTKMHQHTPLTGLDINFSGEEGPAARVYAAEGVVPYTTMTGFFNCVATPPRLTADEASLPDYRVFLSFQPRGGFEAVEIATSQWAQIPVEMLRIICLEGVPIMERNQFSRAALELMLRMPKIRFLQLELMEPAVQAKLPRSVAIRSLGGLTIKMPLDACVAVIGALALPALEVCVVEVVLPPAGPLVVATAGLFAALRPLVQIIHAREPLGYLEANLSFSPVDLAIFRLCPPAPPGDAHGGVTLVQVSLVPRATFDVLQEAHQLWNGIALTELYIYGQFIPPVLLRRWFGSQRALRAVETATPVLGMLQAMVMDFDVATPRAERFLPALEELRLFNPNLFALNLHVYDVLQSVLGLRPIKTLLLANAPSHTAQRLAQLKGYATKVATFDDA
jgi:hypothetical protein